MRTEEEILEFIENERDWIKEIKTQIKETDDEGVIVAWSKVKKDCLLKIEILEWVLGEDY